MKYRAAVGQVLLTLTASSLRAALVDEASEGAVVGSNIAVLELRLGHVDPRFVAGMLNTEAVRRYLRRSAGGTTVALLSLSSLRAFRMPVPPMDVQRRFAEAVAAAAQTEQVAKRLLSSQQQLLEHMALDVWEAGDVHE